MKKCIYICVVLRREVKLVVVAIELNEAIAGK